MHLPQPTIYTDSRKNEIVLHNKTKKCPRKYPHKLKHCAEYGSKK